MLIDVLREVDSLDKLHCQEMDALAHIAGMFSEYIDWRAEHPSDDLMTDLLTGRVRVPEGIVVAS